MNEHVSIEYFAKILEIFKEKNWYNPNDNLNFSFKNYCKLISKFSDPEKDLILELTKDFHCITFSDYIKILIELFYKLVLEELDLLSSKEIIISPLLPLDKIKDETKSSNLICYLFKSCEIKHIIEEFLPNTKISIVENYYSLKKEKNDLFSRNLNTSIVNSSSIIILVDDFIGSGRTAEDSLNFFQNILNIELSNIRIISLVTHQIAKKLLDAKGVKLYTNNLIAKGISDKYIGAELEKKLNLMRKIENTLKVGKNYKLGYQGCEALIRLIRTPNNTFSFFYKKHKKSNAIFPR